MSDLCAKPTTRHTVSEAVTPLRVHQQHVDVPDATWGTPITELVSESLVQVQDEIYAPHYTTDLPDDIHVVDSHPRRRQTYKVTHTPVVLAHTGPVGTYVVPMADAAPDANDVAMFGSGVHVPIPDRGLVSRVGEVIIGALKATGFIHARSAHENTRQRVRLHDSDAHVSPEIKVAYKLMVEGGPCLGNQLHAAGVKMDAVVACGVHIDEWFDAGLTLNDVARLDGEWRHLVYMGLLPEHVFGVRNGTRALAVLCAEPFGLNWTRAATAWGFTLDEGIRRYTMSTSQMALMGADMSKLIYSHGFAPHHVPIVGEGPNSYQMALGATEQQIALLFPRSNPMQRDPLMQRDPPRTQSEPRLLNPTT